MPPDDDRAEVFLLSLHGLAQEVPEAQALAALNDDEQQAVARAKAPLRRAETLYGRYATKWLLGRRLGCAPPQVRLQAPAGEKPRLVAPAGGDNGHGDDGGVLGGDDVDGEGEGDVDGKSAGRRRASVPPRFNVSHSGGLIAVALSGDGEIGVDVERPDAGLHTDIEAIAARHFSAAEAAVIASAAGAAALAEFLRMWTLKEACLKAVGAGLSTPLHQVDVAARRASYALTLQGQTLYAWHRALPAAGCHLAVARVGAPREPRLHDLSGQPRALHHIASSASATS